MKYRIDIEITSAEGHQALEVEADDIEAAFVLFKAGEGDVVEEYIEVTDVEEKISIHDIYENCD